MYFRWVSKDVDLDLLVLYLKKYFKEKKFKVEERRENGKRIMYVNLPRILSGRFKIIIEGDSNNFSVETSFEERKRSLMLFYGLYSLFGGGSLILNEVKFEELMSNIERDLKLFLEKIVPLLSFSQKVGEQVQPS